MRNFDFVGKRKIFFSIPIVITVIALIYLAVFGVKLDIQFKGGALLTYSYTGEIDKAAFQKTVQDLLGETVNVQESTDVTTNSQNLVVSLAAQNGISAEKQLELSTKLEEQFSSNNVGTVSVNVVSPVIGKEFLLKSMMALGFSAVVLIFYIALRFKKISGLSAGVTAVVALIHDIFMVFAVFVFFQMPLNDNFIAVSLTILGYSLNDTIVIYDRVRENKRLYGTTIPVAELMNKSVNQSLSRSVATTFTSVMAMVVVTIVAYLYHVESILSFSFPIIVGMLSGLFSSLCVSPSLWVVWQERKLKLKKA